MNIQKKLILSLGIVLVLACKSYAQEQLSLSDAIQLGLANNFDIQIEALNVEIAKNNNNWGAAGRWPTINFSMSQNNNFRDVQNAANPFQPTGLSISNSLGPGISVSWVLFDGFRVQITRERLQKLQELSMGNAQLIVENTVQAIITQYYFVKLEQERLDVLEKVFTLSKDRYQYIKLKGELGSAVTFDILQEQNAFLTDSSNYVTQEVNYLNARRTLNLLMGQPINNAYELTDSLEIDPTQYDLEVMYDKMVTSNTNLENQFLNLELARTDTRLAKTELYPRLSLNANASYDLSRQDFSQARFPDFGDGGSSTRDLVTTQTTTNYSVGFTVNYLLFDGGRVRRNIENAYTTERISQLQIDQLKLSLRNDLVATYDLYNVRQKLLAISQENIRSSELNLELAEERYKNGTINSFDYRQIQVNYLNTALANAQAKYNMLESETELLRLTGGILNEYENLE
ncbi:TolC family protein [Catalinimonas alkaloidigena]|uniref:TolC family protein n=1 Tax=Catalinimonas alkaloidigena TaxID=1075417 RepID=UPI0024071398|nr:TolC family protein [Catalinimonas alkaloidigena]